MNKRLDLIKEKLDSQKIYSAEEAIDFAKKIASEKFNPSVEISFNLNLNVKKSDQQLRGSVVLPYGTGKTSKILVIADKSDQEIAKKEKADYVDDDKILEKIVKENWFDFDFIVTTPKYMAKIAKYGKLLGPKGLMPNPKLGTVTQDIQSAIRNIKKGQIEYRTNDQGMINLAIGKTSFSTEHLLKNYETVFKMIKSKRPPSVKGDFFKGIYLSTTMGPGLQIAKDGGLK